jgi:hypothetical protein
VTEVYKVSWGDVALAEPAAVVEEVEAAEPHAATVTAAASRNGTARVR